MNLHSLDKTEAAVFYYNDTCSVIFVVLMLLAMVRIEPRAVMFNTHSSYFGGLVIESGTESLLFCLRYFLLILSLSRQMREW
jgi:hypothetical protein